MFDEPVRCSLLTDGKYTFEMADSGDLLSNNEIDDLVDIGRNRWTNKWPPAQKTLRWNITSYTPDMSSRYWQRRTWAVVFRTMGFIIPRRFRYTNSLSKADITIAHIDDLSVFNDRKTVLAQAYLYHPKSSKNGVIEFNDYHPFTVFGEPLPAYMIDPKNYTEGERNPNGTLKMLKTWSELHIGMHEGKHMMGYHHDENSKESIMYPYAKDGMNSNGTINKDAFIWTADDIKRWEEGYGRRSFPIRLLNRFRVRRTTPRTIKGLPYKVVY